MMLFRKYYDLFFNYSKIGKGCIYQSEEGKFGAGVTVYICHMPLIARCFTDNEGFCETLAKPARM